MKYTKLYLQTACAVCLMTLTLCQTAPQTTYQTSLAATDVCADRLSNCRSYGNNSCGGVYLSWAKQNCEATCGFCIAPTMEPPPCVDEMDGCQGFGKETCTVPEYSAWAEKNCRAFCRLCTKQQLEEIDARTTVATTIAPELCVDILECRPYGSDICQDVLYKDWAIHNCPLHCNFCQGVPTPPKPCVDTIPNCASYGTDVCFESGYELWVEDNCAKFCGVCGGNSRPTLASTASTSHATFRTPPPPLTPPLKPHTTRNPVP